MSDVIEDAITAGAISGTILILMWWIHGLYSDLRRGISEVLDEIEILKGGGE